MLGHFVVFEDGLNFTDDLLEGPVCKLACCFEVGQLALGLGCVCCFYKVFHLNKIRPTLLQLALGNLSEVTVIFILQENAHFLEGWQHLECALNISRSLVSFDVPLNNLNFSA